MMMAVLCNEPGSLELVHRDVPVPVAGEVLLRIRRVGVCGTDMHIFRGTQPFLTYPRVMGHELAGEIVSAPQGSSLMPGDNVYVLPYMSCGACAACTKGKSNCCMNIQVLGVHCDGGMAEYLALPEGFVRKAEGISLDQAAMVEFLAIGAHAVRRAAIRPSQDVLVVGAGPIGIAAAIFARLQGGRVTVLDSRADRLAFCRDKLDCESTVLLSARTREELAAATGGDFFDAVFDATGSPKAIEAGFHYVGHGGNYVLISIVRSDISFSDPEFHKREMTLLGSRNALPEDFEAVVQAMRAGLIPTSALNTHKAALADFPGALPGWMEESAGVLKAIVTC